jgi:hypothetical protein
MKPELYTLPTFRVWRFRTEFFAPTVTRPQRVEMASADRGIVKAVRMVLANTVETDAARVTLEGVSEVCVHLVVTSATDAVHVMAVVVHATQS